MILCCVHSPTSILEQMISNNQDGAVTRSAFEALTVRSGSVDLYDDVVSCLKWHQRSGSQGSQGSIQFREFSSYYGVLAYDLARAVLDRHFATMSKAKHVS